MTGVEVSGAPGAGHATSLLARGCSRSGGTEHAGGAVPAHCERRRLKTELIDSRPCPTRTGLRRALFDYIEGWYNTRRLHSSLGYRSPANCEATIHHHTAATAA